MTPRRLTFGLCSFAMLSACVMFNAFYLQGTRMHAARAGSLPAYETTPLALAPLPQDTRSAADTIAAVQRELELRGYYAGPVDGVTTPATRAAIFAFEYDQGLPLSAAPSDTLLRSIILGADAAGPAGAGNRRPGPDAAQLVKTIQRHLNALGYGPVDAAGTYDEATARAISRFEHDQKLAGTGKISATVVARLNGLAPKQR